MPLNKQKGNMYDFITDTWNPIGGKCPHGCIYCSTNKFYYPCQIEKYTGPPKLIESELKTNLGKGNFIFVVAQDDLFADEIPKEWIKEILWYCNQFSNSYLFQSKNPKRFAEFMGFFPSNSVFCTTIETDRHYKSIMAKCPSPVSRAFEMWKLRVKKYVTIEPIMDFDFIEMVELIKQCAPIQVNIGADSGHNHLPEPGKEKILQLIEELEKFTKVKQKSNLKRLLK